MISGYQEALTGAAFDERKDRGRLLVTGDDARSFIQALVTNDVSGLGPGSACYAALLTPQGRMVTDMFVMMRGDGAIHLIVPSDVAAPLAARLDKSIFSEAAEVADVTSATAHFSIVGPAATEIAGDIPDAETWKSDELGVPGVDVIVPAARAAEVREMLAGRAAELSREARRVLRVEAARPEWGIDMNTDTIPLEASLLDRAISTGKGCYVGQEVIIRVLHRGGGRVAKKLVRLKFPAADVPAAGTPLSADGREIGRVTSAVWSPRENAAIGLGYVHRDLAETGEEVTLADGRAAAVTEI